jgi:hypothetical protein
MQYVLKGYETREQSKGQEHRYPNSAGTVQVRRCTAPGTLPQANIIVHPCDLLVGYPMHGGGLRESTVISHDRNNGKLSECLSSHNTLREGFHKERPSQTTTGLTEQYPLFNKQNVKYKPIIIQSPVPAFLDWLPH